MCGLFGFTSDSPKKFSWDKFNILGILNESRGEDACGRFHGNMLEYGLGTESKYTKYISTYNNPPVNFNIILGHTRKASSGGLADVFAQPITLSASHPLVKERMKADTDYKKWVNEMIALHGKDVIVFVVIHNGTIYNYKSLAEKYGITTSFTVIEEKKAGVNNVKSSESIYTKNDSMILAELLYKIRDYSILEEYIGKVAVIFYDLYYTDTLFAFRGESKYSDVSVENSEERPLYCYKMNNNSMYLSSQKEGLFSIGGNNKTVDTIPANTVIKIIGNHIIPIVVIDRSKVFQTETVVNKWNKNKWNKDKWNNHNYEYDYYGNIYNKYNEKAVDTFLDEPFPDLYLHPSLEDSYKLIYWKGGYYVYRKGKKDAVIAHGMYTVNNFGIISKREDYQGMATLYHTTGFSKAFVYNLYFIQGVLMRGKEEYETALKALQSKVRTTSLKMNKYYDVFTHNRFFQILSYHSIYPVVCSKHGEAENVYFAMNASRKAAYTRIYYTGTFAPVFTDTIYEVNVGTLTNTNKARLPGYRKTIADILIKDYERKYFDEAGEEKKNVSLVPATLKKNNPKIIKSDGKIKKNRNLHMAIVTKSSMAAKAMLQVPYALCGICTEMNSDACTTCYLNTHKEYGNNTIVLPEEFAKLHWDLDTADDFRWENADFYQKNKNVVDDIISLAKETLPEEGPDFVETEEIMVKEEIKKEVEKLNTAITESASTLSSIDNNAFINSIVDKFLEISDEIEQLILNIDEEIDEVDVLSGDVYTNPDINNV